MDFAFVDDIYQINLNKAIKQKLPTIKQKEEQLIKSGEWENKKDKRLYELGDYIERLRISKSKLFKKRDKDSIEAQILEAEKEYDQLNKEKQALIGITAEAFANKKINEFYLKNTLYKNEALTVKLYTDNDFDDLENDILNILYKEFEKYNESFNVVMLKKVALSSFFMNIFLISNDDPYVFYGKPVINLTNYQAQVFEYGRQFKNIIQNSEKTVPPEALEDPEKLVEWYESTKQAETLINKTSARRRPNNNDFQAVTMVGASKEDIRNLGYDEKQGKNTTDKFIEAAKKKGSLDFNDVIKLHGA